MSRLTSLRGRLIALNLGLILLGLGGLTVWAGWQIRNAEWNDSGRQLQIDALSLATALGEDDDYSSRSLSLFTQQNEYARITIFNRSGQPLTGNGDTQLVARGTEQTQIDDNGQEWLSASAEIVYAADDDDDDPTGYVQVSIPTEELRETIRERWQQLGIAFGTISLIGMGLTLWLSRSLVRPLSQLRDSALRLAEGDLTERVRPFKTDEIDAVGTAFNTMANQVETMIAEQRAFASNASHELRTPLTTIRLRTEALQSGTLGALDEGTAAQYIADIDSETERMSRLVEDLLLLSRIDANNLAVGYDHIDTSRLVHVVVREYADSDVNITLNLPDEPLTIQANPSHLRVVFRNVIDNAVKYTSSGGAGGNMAITVAQVGNGVQLIVEDDGQGISAADLPHIGKRFYRTDKAHTRTVQGTGLGLALVRSILDVYGGVFTVESVGIGEGTIVYCTFPQSHQ